MPLGRRDVPLRSRRRKRVQARPRIEVVLDGATLTPLVGAALQRMDAEIALQRWEEWNPGPPHGHVDARLLLTNDGRTVTNGKLERLLARIRTSPSATLVLSPTPTESIPRSQALRAHGITFADDVTCDDLVGRLTAMCGMRLPIAHLRRRLRAVRRRRAATDAHCRYMDDQVELAGRLQRDLFACPTPRLSGAQLHVLSRPAEAISGDLHELVRLDERRIGITLIDVTGHGLAAAMLSVHIKQLLRSVRAAGVAEHDPAELLQRLNDQLLATPLSECQCLAALNAVFDEGDRTVRWVRGGMCHPILVRSGKPPVQLIARGPLVGVTPSPSFEVAEVRLEPGDRLFFHSDGVCALLLQGGAGASCLDLPETDWYQRLCGLPTEEAVRALATRLDRTSPDAWNADDLTVVALELTASPVAPAAPHRPASPISEVAGGLHASRSAADPLPVA